MSDQAPKLAAQVKVAPASVSPVRFRRVGRKGFRCELPRTFAGYFPDTKTAVLGAATKFILRSNDPSQPQYIVKYAQKHGRRETLTEFFINRLGASLGLNIAHSGLIRSDQELAFATKIFLATDESLRHGSLVIEDCFKRTAALDVQELDRIQRRTEQEFYSIDFVTGVLRDFCGQDFDDVFPPFIEMLVFDALIGSMDRHSQNWGVIAKSRGPVTYRFSPIFDTARSLLWSLDEDQIETLCGEDESNPNRLLECEKRLHAYIENSRPCMGPERSHPRVNKCNHFNFVENLLKLYPNPTMMALGKVTQGVEAKAYKLLRQFPFALGFTGKRKRLIIKILSIRANRLREILKEGRNLT